MRRWVVVGLLLGLLNGVAVAAALLAVHETAPKEVGWFAYAPVGETVEYDWYGFPWEYVVVPVFLLVLNALVVPIAMTLGWLKEQEDGARGSTGD